MTGNTVQGATLAKLLMALAVAAIAENALADNPYHTGDEFPAAQPASAPVPGDPAPPADCPTAGDPIYLYLGDFQYTRDEVTIPGKGMPVEIKLTYWSQREYNNRYGYNWFMCYNVRLVKLANNSIEVVWGCGGRDNYTYDSQDQSYTAPPGTFDELVAVGSMGYTLTKTDGTIYSFDSGGKLTKITDRNDNEITFAYNSGGPLPIVGKSRYVTGTPVAMILANDWMLTTITDTKGDDIDFQYNANGRLETITDYAGRQWEYNYSNDDDLEFITTPPIASFPAGLVTQFSYDTAHHLQTVTDPEDQTRVTNTYYASGRLNTQTFGTGTMILTYNDATRTTTVVDGEGHTTDYTFSADSMLVGKKEYTDGVPAGEPAYFQTTYTYTAYDQLEVVTYPRNNSVKYKYDGRGNVTEERRRKIGATSDNDAADIVTKATYHPDFALIATFTDAKNKVTTFEYTDGNLTEITYPTAGSQTPVVTIAYTSSDQVELVTDANGNKLKYEYDSDTGYVHKIRLDPNGINATFELGYDNVGNITSIKDARNNITTFAYNALNWLTSVTNPLGYQTKYTYDGNGNVKKVERQANSAGTSWQTTQYTYTAANLLKTITNPLNKVTTYNYDDNNNLSSIVDADTHTTSYVYDDRNLLWRVTDALSKITEYGYDNNGNLKTIKDANGRVTKYGSDEFDRLVRLTYDDASYERVGLDKNGNVDSLLVNTDLLALYTWDALGRLTTIAYPGGDTATYTYNAGSQLVEAANSVSTLSYMYDALGRVDSVRTTVAGPHTYGVGYRYDKNSNRRKLFYPSGYIIDATHTAINALDEVRSGGMLINYDYDTLGRRIFRDIPAKLRFIQSFYEYDGADQLTRVLNRTLRPTGGEEEPEYEWGFRNIWKRLLNWANRPAWAGTGITISDFTYTYDDVGNRLTMSVDGSTHTYGYDAIYQLTSVSGAQSHTYDYDDVGNREEADGIDYTSNNLNQYTEVNSVDFDYDERGNLTDDGTNTYTYDSENRLTSVTAGSNDIDYAYDPFGRRQWMSVNGAKTYYVYDGDHILAEYDNAGTMKREYVYGPWLDEVVSILRVSPKFRCFYYQDGLGSISEIMDSTGVLFEQYEYEPYGKTTVKNKTGTVLPNGSAIGNRFAFAGRRLDYETKLYDYRARVYSTEIGRFLQRDPVMTLDGMNIYSYTGNSPTTFGDPFGMFCSPFQLWLKAHTAAEPFFVAGGFISTGLVVAGTGGFTVVWAARNIGVTGGASLAIAPIGASKFLIGLAGVAVGVDIYLDEIRRRVPGNPEWIDLLDLDIFGQHETDNNRKQPCADCP
jgi:RHS repeat-associated protein